MYIQFSSFSRDAATYLTNSVLPSLTSLQNKIILIASLALASVMAFFVTFRYFQAKPQEQNQKDKSLTDNNLTSIKVDGEAKTVEHSTSSKIESTSPEIVDKPIAETVPPLGFTNYGNACWFVSGLQILLASHRFRALARAPLKRETYDVIASEKWESTGKKNVRPPTIQRIVGEQNLKESHNKWVSHTETDVELQARKNVQGALIHVIDAKEKRNQEELDRAIKNFHQTILDNCSNYRENLRTFPQIGAPAYAQLIIYYLLGTFVDDQRICRSSDIDFFLSSSPARENNPTGEDLKPLPGAEMPDIIMLHTFNSQPKTYDLNQIVDLSAYAPAGHEARYRVISALHPLPGSVAADIRVNDQWYYCVGQNVQKTTLQTLDIDSQHEIVLERINDYLNITY